MADNDNRARDEQDARPDRAFEDRLTKQGPAALRAQVKDGDEFAIAGNARQRGEDPSPDDRDRGDTSIREPAPPVDIDR